MKNDSLAEITAFLNWYKDIYGSEIYLDSEIELLPPVISRTQTPEIKHKKQSDFKDLHKKNEFSIHQDHQGLKSFFHEINACTKCSLAKTRKNFVFGMGNPSAEVMFVGEAPGNEEDIKGLPFVGRAGQLLDKMLFALGLKREEVFIANVLKCRPPNNRDPLPEEVLQCEPYLVKQIGIVRPKVIVALGRISAQVLLKKDASLSSLRQMDHHYENIPFVVTYHPAALLRNPGWKSKAWIDLKRVNTFLKN